MVERRSLADLLAPASTVLLTQECQQGVLGEPSALPQLAAAARETGALDNIGMLCTSARAAGVGVLHAIAARRADGRGGNTNARLFNAASKLPVLQLEGTRAVQLMPELGRADSDLFSTRYHSLSPVLGTDVDGLLRNLGCTTVVLVGVSSNIAIPNATFDLVNLGYQVVLASDALAGTPTAYTAQILEHSLSFISTVTTTREIMDCWCATP